jgi:hypothetical protein
MWADNETATDLLGFDVLVDELVVALTNPALHPLTIGVLGSWGSGKSSLLSIAMAELEAEGAGKYACVAFSPWQYEDVEDIKTALMTAVLKKCQDLAPNDETTKAVDRLWRRLPRFGRRAGVWAATAAPAAVPAILAGVDPGMSAELITAAQGMTQSGSTLAAEALKEPDDQGESPTKGGEIVDSVAKFRDDLAGVMKSLPVDAVVVFIDDLDRCLPPTIVDTFEALRLFLHTPKTAHVVAISRDIVEAAINSRYPEFNREDGTGIGHEYLEKMLQLQVRVPELSSVEIETYLNLLLTQSYVQEERFTQLVAELGDTRRGVAFPPAYNAGVATQLLGDDFPAELAADLAWASGICDVATSGLRGNPRELKRFLNDLTWRRRAAARRGLDLKPDVLAKLMVLDDQMPDDFQKLFDWQHQSDGPSLELRLAEEFATGQRTMTSDTRSATPVKKSTKKAVDASKTGTESKTAPASTAPDAGTSADDQVDEPSTNSQPERGSAPIDSAVEAMLQQWVSRPRIASWLRIPPLLGEIDLRIYFSYFRDRLTIGTSASTLDPRLQALLGRILHEENNRVRRAAIDEVGQLSEPDQDALLEALLDAARRKPDSNAFRASAEVGGRVKRLGPVVCEALQTIPHQLVQPMRILPAIAQLKDSDGADALIAAWKASTVAAVATVTSKAGTAR